VEWYVILYNCVKLVHPYRKYGVIWVKTKINNTNPTIKKIKKLKKIKN